MKVATQATGSTEYVIKGEALALGIASGSLWNCPLSSVSVPHYILLNSEIAAECERLAKAKELCRAELLSLKAPLDAKVHFDVHSLLNAQLQMLEDPFAHDEIISQIQSNRYNAEWAIQTFLDNYRDLYNVQGDQFFKERYHDCEDLFQRIINLLLNGKQTEKQPQRGAVVVSEHLTTSQAAEAVRARIGAFVTSEGSHTAHPTIIAKSHGIPFVTGIDLSVFEKFEVKKILVDGYEGKVIINPTPKTLNAYRLKRLQLEQECAVLSTHVQSHVETEDGHCVRLTANLEVENEIDLYEAIRKCGVGLYRSEYLYFSKNCFPEEEEQFRVYCSLLKQLENTPLVIRAFDIGGDKQPSGFAERAEYTPYLGYRAIRFLLRQRGIFTSQLRAVVRASQYGHIKLLLPMISGLQELVETKAMLREVTEDIMREYGTDLNPVAIGCMIEVPSAALIADILAKECDFLSIGTNDLIQYTLAVDRENNALRGHYAPAHPGVVRMLDLIIKKAKGAEVPVSVCGEIASDPYYTPLLMGLGVSEFSVAPPLLSTIYHSIQLCNLERSRLLTAAALEVGTTEEVLELLRKEYERRFPQPPSFHALLHNAT